MSPVGIPHTAHEDSARSKHLGLTAHNPLAWTGSKIVQPRIGDLHSRADTAVKDVLGDRGPISVPLCASASPFIHAVAFTESVVSKMGCELKISHGELLKIQMLRVHPCLQPQEAPHMPTRDFRCIRKLSLDL